MGSNFLAGSLLVLVVSTDAATFPSTSVSDGTNTYTKLDAVYAASIGGEFWYCPNCQAVTSPVVSVGFASSGQHNLVVREYTGLVASPVDVHAATTSAFANPSISSPATGNANELVIGWLVTNNLGVTVGAGYGNFDHENSLGYSVNMQDKISGGAGVQSTAFGAVSSNGAIGIATFVQGASSGSVIGAVPPSGILHVPGYGLRN